MVTITPLSDELLQKYHESLMRTYTAMVPSSEYTLSTIIDHFNTLTKQGSTIFVALDNELGIVGTITVIIEYKIIRGGVKAGHIEDLAVQNVMQGNGVGGALLDKAIAYATQQGCYKIILDCEQGLEGYYAKKGFVNQGIFMRKYCKECEQ